MNKMNRKSADIDLNSLIRKNCHLNRIRIESRDQHKIKKCVE